MGGNGRPFRDPDRKAKSSASLGKIIDRTAEIWKSHDLDYEDIRYVTREVRRRLSVKRPDGNNKSRAEPLTADETRALLDAARSDGNGRGLLLLILLESGARVSEFIRLRPEDFSPETGRLRINGRTVALTPETAEALGASIRAQPRTHLFESNRGAPFTPRRVQQIVRELARRAGIARRVHPGLLRRTIARLRLSNGADLAFLKEFLGHERLQSTKPYADPEDGDGEAART